MTTDALGWSLMDPKVPGSRPGRPTNKTKNSGEKLISRIS